MAVKTRKLPAPEVLPAANHPMHKYLREDRLPHIWCSGCGLGTALSCFTHALDELGLGPKDVAVVSGIGCTGRVAGYVNLDSYHTTHGRAIPFASGLTVAQPEKKVVVFSGDGDLFAIGGNHFIHAARRNIDMTVICVNNFNYGMTGGQFGPTRCPRDDRSVRELREPVQPPLPRRVERSRVRGPLDDGSRPPVEGCDGGGDSEAWVHVRRDRLPLSDELRPAGRNGLGDGLEETRYYAQRSIIHHGADPKEADLIPGQEIVVGKFVERDRPTFLEMYEKQIVEKNKLRHF